MSKCSPFPSPVLPTCLRQRHRAASTGSESQGARVWELLGEKGGEKKSGGVELLGRIGVWGCMGWISFSCSASGCKCSSFTAIAEFSLPSRENKAHALSLLTTSRYDAGGCTMLPQCLFVV